MAVLKKKQCLYINTCFVPDTLKDLELIMGAERLLQIRHDRHPLNLVEFKKYIFYYLYERSLFGV